MKHMQKIIAVFIFAALLMVSYASLAQEGQSAPFTGFTVTRGEWVLKFTGVTDDQEEIRKGQSEKGDRSLVANPGYKIIRLSMDVPLECKRSNCDDLEITLVDKAGDEHGFSTRSYWTRLENNEDALYKIEYLIIVPESMTYDDLKMRVVVTGQEEYTCTLAEVFAGEKAIAPEAETGSEPVSSDSIPSYSGGDEWTHADAVMHGLPITVWGIRGAALTDGPFMDWKIDLDESGSYAGLHVYLVSPGSGSSVQDFYDAALRGGKWAKGNDVSGDSYNGYTWTRGSQAFVAVIIENIPALSSASSAGTSLSWLITYLLNK